MKSKGMKSKSSKPEGMMHMPMGMGKKGKGLKGMKKMHGKKAKM